MSAIPNPRPADGAQSAPSLIQQLSAAWREMRALVGAMAELARLEAREAGERLVKAAIFGAVAAVTGVCAWLFLCASLAILIADQGVPLWLCVGGVAVLNIGIAAVMAYAALGAVKRELFPATRRQLGGGNPAGARATEHT